jgi:hypothetical protein
MRLAAIYNVWDDWDLLEHSLKNIGPLVDGRIIVFSVMSNFGEHGNTKTAVICGDDTYIFKYEPDLNLIPAQNERAKRNFGLQKAKELGFTHFIMMDADEFYEPEPFLKEKERFLNPDLAGLVCGLKCYFKSPTMTVPDKTLVPFIHKITPDLCFAWNTKYPYAFQGPRREIRIDPTRQMNINSGVEWSDITMHHMSWVRSDVRKKIRNSTARQNIEKSTIVRDYVNAKEGYYCEFYRAKIESCENLFNLPQIVDESISSEPN